VATPPDPDSEDCLLCPGVPVRLRLHAGDPMLGDAGAGYPIYQCPSCGLMVTRLPPGHGLRDYPDDYLERIAEQREAGDRSWEQVFWRRLASVHRFRAPGRVLDVGCGDGSFLRALGAVGWEASGTEMDGAVVDALRRRSLRVLQGELPALGLPEHQLDAITYFGSFEHVARPLEELRAARRLLRPEGVLLLNLTNTRCLEAWLLRGSWFGFEAPRHRYNYTLTSLERMLGQAGLRVLHAEYQDNTFISTISLARRLGLGRRYARLLGPLTLFVRGLRWMARRFDPGNVLEVVAGPRA